MRVITNDGTNFMSSDVKLVGSVKTKRSRDIHDAVAGEYPVFVEQYGDYKMFTYTSKIATILKD